MSITENRGTINLIYQEPPDSILQLADFDRNPNVTLDAKNNIILLIYRNTYKSIDELIQPEIRLAGLRVNPTTNISTSINYIVNLKIRQIQGTETIQVKGLPDKPRISMLNWSPNDRKVAFCNTTVEGVELWVLDIETAIAKRLTDARLNANISNPATWYRDSESILVRIIPQNRPPLLSSAISIPYGPVISVSDGTKAQNRTTQDLLKNQTDETNFVTLASSELVKVNLNGETSIYKTADIYIGEEFSPDGSLLLITIMHKPFSYLVGLNRFPQKTIVYDLQGNAVKTIAENPLTEVLPQGFMAVHTGKRYIGWRADEPATLYYVEANDGGDPRQQARFRDTIYLWEAPFDNAPVLLAQTALRFSGILWGNNSTAVLNEEWYDTRIRKTSLINPEKPGAHPRLFKERNFQDMYSDPGTFEMQKTQSGTYVLKMDQDKLYLSGEGFTPDGQFPFLDELDVKIMQTKRLYQSTETSKKEELFELINVQTGDILIRLQSKNESPNFYIRNFKQNTEPKKITHFSNPFASIANVYKEVIRYQREDGVELSGTLYLPEGYDRESKAQKLPLLIWAYPAEYKDKHSAGQNTSNANEFTFPHHSSFVYWVTRGYAVLDDAAFPIVGEANEEPNDTFVEQLIANAKAAIDAVDAMGFINREKVAIGGHSYGAFMVANLLTHSKLFACGIARSGAYNRTLTPFGFQSEQRNYWEAQQIYNAMSPFMHAEKMKIPMLLVHGEADNNAGTFTLQTERYFHALRGLGAPVRMVILPKEMHSYVARENILHLLWEQDQFLERYLQ